MKMGIHIGYYSQSPFVSEPVYSIPIIILYTVIEMALFFGGRKFLFAVTLSFRIIFMLHDIGYGIYHSVEASNVYVEWYCEKEQTLHLLNTTVEKTVAGGPVIMNLLTLAMFAFAIVSIPSTTVNRAVITRM